MTLAQPVLFFHESLETNSLITFQVERLKNEYDSINNKGHWYLPVTIYCMWLKNIYQMKHAMLLKDTIKVLQMLF